MDDNMETEQSKAFIRQRRNLIGISFLLLFYLHLNISISEINIFGTKMIVKESSRIICILWVVWAYLLWRYYQYYRQVAHNKLHAILESRMNLYAPEAALAKFIKSYNPDKDAVDIPKPHEITLDQREQNQTVIQSKLPDEWQIKALIHIAGTKSGSAQYREIILARYDLFKMKTRAYIYVAIHSPVATDYHLPFLIALVPLVRFFL